MKKIFTLIAVAAMALGANAQKIAWDAPVAAGSLDATYSNGDFKLTRLDTDGKHSIDANNAYFGDASAQEKLTHRLKVGGKSGNKNGLSLTIPSAGLLKVYVRTGSNSATDRNLVLTQSGKELYNKVVQESDATTVVIEENKSETNPTGETKVYPIISVAVAAGTVDVAYPVNSLNFYAFEFVAGEGGGEGGGQGEGGQSGFSGTASITWTEVVAAGSLDATYADGDFKLTRLDTDGKHSIDANNAYFGDASAQEKLTHRLKVGGKSGAKNGLSLTIPAAATLKVYVRTGSNSATDRNLVLTQSGTELYNKVVQESDAITVVIEENKSETNPTGETKVYPIISVAVAAGTVDIAYPVNSLNFYGFKLEGTTGIESVKAVKFNANAPMYNLAGQKVDNSYKGVVIQNGKKFMIK